MKREVQIQYLRRAEVDDVSWNTCMTNASNGLIYGYTIYLDHMAEDWDGLVLNDYEAVMPLPWRKKWGISYLYQPFLTAQLGVFGNNLSAETVTAFLQAVPKKFWYWEFPLNHQNRFAIASFPLHERMNYVLNLQSTYEVVYKAYRENIRRNIKKSNDLGCRLVTDIALENIIALTKFQAADIAQKDFNAFKNVFRELAAQGKAKTYGVLSPSDQLIASAAFLFSHNRAYYILVGNHPNGRTLGASHALVDGFIRDHAGQNLLLDFEGSDIRNLAFFYSSFGAQEERYAAIRLNRLPWWAKWLKSP